MDERQLLALMSAIVYGTAQPEHYETAVRVARRLLQEVNSELPRLKSDQS